MLGAVLVAEEVAGSVDEEGAVVLDSETLDFWAEDVEDGRDDSASLLEAADSEVTVKLSDEAASVETLGVSVVRLGKLEPLLAS